MEKLKEIPSILDILDKKVKNLFFIGDCSFLNKTIISIVGSRRPSAYTNRMVTLLANELSKRNVYVISGAAMGVDALAHKGAFPKTIAVLGNSLDIIYPKINEKLIQNIYSRSLALSEYPKKTPATRYSFIERNRIVVGLSQAVVIAQADFKSGSMHSANFAIKYNKPLFVLPQRLKESQGTNYLLATKKASLIYDIEKFADIFGVKREEDDPVLNYCKNNINLQECLNKYGEKIYEYELDGKLEICGTYIKVL